MHHLGVSFAAFVQRPSAPGNRGSLVHAPRQTTARLHLNLTPAENRTAGQIGPATGTLHRVIHAPPHSRTAFEQLPQSWSDHPYVRSPNAEQGVSSSRGDEY